MEKGLGTSYSIEVGHTGIEFIKKKVNVYHVKGRFLGMPPEIRLCMGLGKHSRSLQIMC